MHQRKVGGQGRGKPCPYISGVWLSLACELGWLPVVRMRGRRKRPHPYGYEGASEVMSHNAHPSSLTLLPLRDEAAHLAVSQKSYK
jgi:hypothetical protein